MISCRQGLLAAVGVCLLAGCGGGGDPGAEPLPPITSTSATPPGSATPTGAAAVVSPFPATAQGARDFTRYLYAQIDRAYAAKDPELVRNLFTADCEACARYLSTLTGLRDGNVSLKGGPKVVLDAATPGTGTGPTVTVIVRLQSPGAVITTATGNESREPAGVYNLEILLATTERAFQAASIRALSVDPS